jgi:hypothetical protein
VEWLAGLISGARSFIMIARKRKRLEHQNHRGDPYES